MYVCMYVCQRDITNPMDIEQVRITVRSPSENTLRVCNQITLFVLYCISSRLVTRLKISNDPVNISFFFFLHLLLVSSSSILSFRYSFFLFVKCLLTSFLTFFRLCTLLCFGSCNHSILAYFLCSKNINIYHHTTVYAASIRTDLDSLSLKF